MATSKEIWRYISTFIKANPDIKRIGLNKKDFEKLVEKPPFYKAFTIINNEIHHNGYIIYSIGGNNGANRV